MLGPDFLPTATLDMLRRRAALLQRVRRFFDDRGFLEVETPLLSHDTVVDRHLNPISATFFKEPRQPERGERMWLQTSPEFCMKRLLAAGATAIYQITKAFRGGPEISSEHNPEFTIVEWYRVGDDYQAGMDLLAALAQEILQAGPAERLTYREAFLRHVGLDPHTATRDELAQAAGWTSAPYLTLGERDRDELLNMLLACSVEEHLGRVRPTILYDYPATQAALARTRPGARPDEAALAEKALAEKALAEKALAEKALAEPALAEPALAEPALAERFELYYGGLELANGYHELLDPAVLRERNRSVNLGRQADGKYLLPEESRLLAAMEQGLPSCSGCALGFDRLVMAATGARSIEEVIAFPIHRA